MTTLKANLAAAGGAGGFKNLGLLRPSPQSHLSPELIAPATRK